MPASPGAAGLINLLDVPRLKEAIPSGGKILVGVSGGADSMALIMALQYISRRYNWEISAAHINHGLRAEADAEMQFVADACSAAGVTLHLRHLHNAAAIEGGSAEGYWRRLRYQAFAEIARDTGSSAVALGHNADDLAETFLFHLIRGTGVAGLTFSFDSVSSGLRIVRPLWKTKRTDIETALKAADCTWKEDPSNSNLRHTRNLIRLKVMPLLREINPQASSAIVRASEAISVIAGPAGSPDPVSFRQGDRVISEARQQLPQLLPLAVLRTEKSDRHGLSNSLKEFISTCGLTCTSRQLDQLLKMVVQGQVGLVSLCTSQTLVLTREFLWHVDAPEPSDALLAQKHTEQFGGFYAYLSTPNFLAIPEAQPEDIIPGISVADALDQKTYKISIRGAAPGWRLRNRIPGDLAGTSSLKKLLNAASVPWYLRDRLVLIADAENHIVGVVGDHPRLQELIQRKSRIYVDSSYHVSTQTNRA